ncbi:MAG TPA: metal-sensitive transcriptional regulator [Fimbriimonadaceae bacterium]|nr:metal-sensitive transcriptional regulator [Fimbriimonadaceae bacterium]
MDTEEKKSIDRRLARIEGQIRGIRRMVEKGEYCCDILNQIAAVSSALSQTAASVASQHVKHCIVSHDCESAHSQAKTMTQDELLDELDEVFSRLMRA